jgi:DNA polymerase-3 subunit gamma/tau
MVWQMTEALINKYRPISFDEVVGHDAVVRSLQTVLKRGSSKTFLFTGPSGVGKTTLARIVAKEVGCAPADLLEIDAVTFTGIDDMRAVTANLIYKPLGEGAVKAIIIDEFQGLSKAALQSLLKILEEPPAHVFWFLCTTEPTRIPENIRTRCTRYDLKPVSIIVLGDLLEDVANKEKLNLDGKIIDLCAREANGSPRQALVNLTACSGAKNYAEAQELLRSAIESEEAIDLARALVRGAKWIEVQQLLNGLAEINPESVRHLIRSYLTKVILNAKSEAAAGRGLEMLSEFDTPFNSADGLSPLVLACGKVLLS